MPGAGATVTTWPTYPSVPLDNRPFLRALHGLALCRSRMGDFEVARAICESLLWLNPNDNPRVRDIHDLVARRLEWLPHDTWG